MCVLAGIHCAFWGTGFGLVLLVLLAVAFDIFLEDRFGSTPLGKYLPTIDNAYFYLLAVLVIVAAGYGAMRYKFGAEKMEKWLNQALDRFFGRAT